MDSPAVLHGNYLAADCKNNYDVIITNPPFNIALDIIKKALDDVKTNGLVIMLQRLNFLGSQTRSAWFKQNMPAYIYVHSRRMKFHNTLSTDSIEYAHYAWFKDCHPHAAQLRVI